MNNQKRKSLITMSILGLILIIGVIIITYFNPEKESFFIPCLVYKTTGFKCAGCGMTRAIHYLFNGDIKKAIWYNIMIVPLFGIILYTLYRYIRYIVKDEPVLNNVLEFILKLFLAILIVFMIARNFTDMFY